MLKCKFYKYRRKDNSILLMTDDDLKDTQSITWYIDIGTFNHISDYKKLFAKINMNYSSNINFCNLL